jgi:hypothetical protein
VRNASVLHFTCPAHPVCVAGSSLLLMSTFTPKSQSIFNINVSYNLCNNTSKLTLNVKGEGFVIRFTVSVDDSEAGTTPVMPNRSFPL